MSFLKVARDKTEESAVSTGLKVSLLPLMQGTIRIRSNFQERSERRNRAEN